MFGRKKKKEEDKCDTCPLQTNLLNTTSLQTDLIKAYRDRTDTLLIAVNQLKIRYMDLLDENEGLKKELKKWKGKEVVQFI